MIVRTHSLRNFKNSCSMQKLTLILFVSLILSPHTFAQYQYSSHHLQLSKPYPPPNRLQSWLNLPSTLIDAQGQLEFEETDDGVYAGDILQYIVLPSYIQTSSCKKPPQQEGITIFTQTGLERLDLVYDMAERWPWGISVAVYIDSPDTLTGFAEKMEEFMNKFDDANSGELACVTVSLLLGSRFTIDRKEETKYHPYDFLYPINALRNLALEQCSTPWVLSLDVDFMPSTNLAQYLSLPSVRDKLETAKKTTLFVIAAFEMVKPDIDSTDVDKEDIYKRVPNTFADLQTYCRQGLLVPFHARITIPTPKQDRTKLSLYCSGKLRRYHVQDTGIQGYTNYTRWFSAVEPYRLPTRQLIDRYYEPYFVALKSELIPFDERFRGYAFNKRSHSIAMQAKGFGFVVLPQVFVTHRWHPKSKSKKALEGKNIKSTVGRAYTMFLRDTGRAFGDTRLRLKSSASTAGVITDNIDWREEDE